MKNLAVGRFIFQKGTRADLIESALILLDGEVAMETDTQLMKVGDGKTEYKALPYLNRGAKGDKGEKGEKGDTGTSLSVLGTVSSTNELPKTAKDGDGYMIDGDLYIAKNNKFTNVGRIQGPKGDRGLKGDKGNTGDRGIQGVKGDKGDRGAQGFKGDQGERGPQGPKGDRGDVGPIGKTGPQGEQGPIGPKGATGPQGPIGQTGPTGAKGDKGDPLTFDKLTDEQKKDIANRIVVEEVAKEYVKTDRITSNLNDTDTGKIVNLTGIKALKDGIDGELKKKAPAETGKGLSTNDFTNDFKATLEELTMSNPPSSDFNSVSKQGIYNGDFSSNCPNGSGKYTLIVCPTDSSNQHKTNYMFQIAIRDNSDSTPYFRQRRGSSTWGKWYKFSTNDYTDSDKKKVNAIPSNAKYTDTTYSNASTSSDGLMSASDKKKLDNMKEQVILTETEYNTLSDGQKNDSSKIYFVKE